MFIKVVALIKKCMDDGIVDVAAQLSYFLILSFFPALLFILALVNWSNMDAQAIYTFLKAMVPGVSYELISDTILGTFSKVNWDVLSVGIIITVYSASRGVRSLMKGLNKAYNIKENRNLIKRVLISCFFIIGIAFMIISSLGLVVLGEVIGRGIGDWMSLDHDFQLLWNAYRILFAVLSIFLVFLIIYYILPARKVNIMQIVPGAVIATLGWILASIGFSYYVENLSDYTAVYGGLGAVIVFMVWIYLTSLVILIGGEVNSSILLKCNRELNE